MSPWRLTRIARQIDRGAIIAYPTDTIWGLGCSPVSSIAITRIQQLKKRAPNKGLILLSSELQYLRPYIDTVAYKKFHDQLFSITTRPTTWIIKASKYCPRWLTGLTDTVAIRLTQAPQVKALCHILQSPIVSTSANISGRTPIRNSLLAHKHFQERVDYIIEGFNTGSQQASEIRDLKSGKILRS